MPLLISSVYMMLLLTILLMIINVVNVVISEDTCQSLTEKSHFKLHNCTFLPNVGGYANSTIRCDILNTVNDYRDYVDNTFYIHVKLLFEVIAVEPVARTILCLRLSAFEVDKVIPGELWNNVTIGEISPNFNSIWRYVKNGFIKTKFRNAYPGALLQIDDDCQRTGSCNPNNKVNILRQLEESVAALDFFNESSWKNLKNWYHSLGGYDTQMMLDLDSKMGLIKPKYISVIISDINMKYLRLTGGRFSHLDKTLLKNKWSLKVLDLTSNGINDIHIDTFLETPELESLILADNALKKVPSGIEKLKSLRHLDLSNNIIKEQNSLEGLKKLSLLKSLSISYMKLRDLHNLTCQSEFQLEILLMSHCDIKLMNEDDLRCQKELKIIDLSFNKLRDIPSEIVSAQKNLVALNVANNLLTKGPNIILHNNVTVLKISNNRLVDISSIIAAGHVEFLDLSGNNISSWSDENVFDGKVKKLNVSHNSINLVTREMVKSYESLEVIDLGDNLFDCSYCYLPFFQLWLLENSTDVLYNLGGKEPLTCSTPPIYRDKNIIKADVDISPCIPDNSLAIGFSIAITLVYILLVTMFIVRRCRRLARLRNMKMLANSNDIYDYDAFICYSEEDREWVSHELLPTLENEPSKYKLRLDERDLISSGFEFYVESHPRFPYYFIQSFKPPSLSPIQKTVRSLQTSRNTIMILSNNFFKSEWCQWELELASHKLIEDQRDFLILIELEELDESIFPYHWSIFIKYLQNTCTYMKWYQNNENGRKAWKELRDVLGTSIYNKSVEKGTSTQGFSIVVDEMAGTSMNQISIVEEETLGTSMRDGRVADEDMVGSSMDDSNVVCVDEEMAIITNR